MTENHSTDLQNKPTVVADRFFSKATITKRRLCSQLFHINNTKIALSPTRFVRVGAIGAEAATDYPTIQPISKIHGSFLTVIFYALRKGKNT